MDISHHLPLPVEDHVDELVWTRSLHGEDLDDTSGATRRMVVEDARLAVADIVEFAVPEGDGRLRIWRAVRTEASAEDLDMDAVAGESWSFTRSGAHPYVGTRGWTVVAEALVDPGDVQWMVTVAMWSSGEGECRLARDAVPELIAIHDAGRRIEVDASGPTHRA
jgi:hypothetical protein